MCRTGHRTLQGIVNDAVYSVIRYLNNNFRDGYFEDCINLTFNYVQMGPNADRHMKGVIRNTFMMFVAVVLVFEHTNIYTFLYISSPGLDGKEG